MYSPTVSQNVAIRKHFFGEKKSTHNFEKNVFTFKKPKKIVLARQISILPGSDPLSGKNDERDRACASDVSRVFDQS
jgi:hypothetical protein